MSKVVLLLILLAALVCLGSCTIIGGRTNVVLDKAVLAETDTVLVSYRSAIVSTVGGDCSETLVLMTTGDFDKLRLDCISKPEDGEQIYISYIVPTTAVEDCLAYINEADLKAWQKLKNPIAWDGMVKSCTFRDGDQYVTVSTDAMPEDGAKVLSHIGQILKGYAVEAEGDE